MNKFHKHLHDAVNALHAVIDSANTHHKATVVQYYHMSFSSFNHILHDLEIQGLKYIIRFLASRSWRSASEMNRLLKSEHVDLRMVAYFFNFICVEDEKAIQRYDEVLKNKVQSLTHIDYRQRFSKDVAVGEYSENLGLAEKLVAIKETRFAFIIYFLHLLYYVEINLRALQTPLDNSNYDTIINYAQNALLVLEFLEEVLPNR